MYKCKYNPIIGDRYNMLVILEDCGMDNRGNRIVKVKCDCGVIKNIRFIDLRKGKIVSCNCWGRGSEIKKTHGMTKTRFYKIYLGIKDRCKNKNIPSYKNYGGRGIKYSWGNFKEFYSDMFHSYNKHIKRYGTKNTMIERINNNGDYTKSNCKWATREEQNNNKRSNRFIKLKGKKYRINELAEKLGMNYYTLYSRIFTYKMPLDIALDTKKYPRH